MKAPPDPEGVFTVIHDGRPATVQLHAALVESATVPLPPATGIESELGDSDELRQGSAAWLTVNVTPAIERVALRAAPVLAGYE